MVCLQQDDGDNGGTVEECLKGETDGSLFLFVLILKHAVAPLQNHVSISKHTIAALQNYVFILKRPVETLATVFSF